VRDIHGRPTAEGRLTREPQAFGRQRR
jgi:hypothetical protein